jgi:hypothetical protein
MLETSLFLIGVYMALDLFAWAVPRLCRPAEGK